MNKQNDKVLCLLKFQTHQDLFSKIIVLLVELLVTTDLNILSCKKE